MSLFLRNLVAIGVPLLLGSLLSLLLNYTTRLVSQNWYYGIIFLLISTFILNLVYASRAGKEGFTQLMLAAIVIKLLLTLIAILVYSFINKPDFFYFSIQFILHFILFTVFEIRYLQYIIKTHPIKQH